MVTQRDFSALPTWDVYTHDNMKKTRIASGLTRLLFLLPRLLGLAFLHGLGLLRIVLEDHDVKATPLLDRFDEAFLFQPPEASLDGGNFLAAHAEQVDVEGCAVDVR